MRGDDGIDWIPQRAADDCGIGRQVGIFDVNKDQLPDIVVGGMKGCAVITQTRKVVDLQTWKAAQPAIYKPTDDEVSALSAELEKKKALTQRFPATVLEGEALKVIRKTGGELQEQKMNIFSNDKWSGDSQQWWKNVVPGHQLEFALPVEKTGSFDLMVLMTKAADYCIVQFTVDDKIVGPELDLYNSPDVVNSGLINLGTVALTAGNHRLGIKVVGANAKARRAVYVRLGCRATRLAGWLHTEKEGWC